MHALREQDFPTLREAIYLNAASVGPLPERARREVERVNHLRARVHAMEDDDFVAPLHRCRAAAARLIGADPGEIALGWNTSFGINLAALSLPIPEGSCVVASDREFPANVYPWMAVPGARLELVPATAQGLPDEERLAERLSRGDVSVFALSSVQFASGYRADLRRFGEICRAHGVFFVVDAIQQLGQIPLDVRSANVDVLAVGGHKWLLSPFGTGFAYVRRELLERMEPRVVGWTGLRASADLSSLLDYRWDFRADARRFEVATLPLQDFAGMAESLELLLEVGVDRVEAHLQRVLEPLLAWLRERPEVEVVGDPAPARRSAIVSVLLPDAEEHFRALRQGGVVCSLREGAIRFAPHLYNTEEEMSRVVEILDAKSEGRWS